jgi:hypothetical protein
MPYNIIINHYIDGYIFSAIVLSAIFIFFILILSYNLKLNLKLQKHISIIKTKKILKNISYSIAITVFSFFLIVAIKTSYDGIKLLKVNFENKNFDTKNITIKTNVSVPSRGGSAGIISATDNDYDIYYPLIRNLNITKGEQYNITYLKNTNYILDIKKIN